MEITPDAMLHSLQGDKPITARFLTKPETITDDMVISTLKAVVAEQPDYVYAAPSHMTDDAECYYVHTDDDGANQRPGCVVGHVLHRLGISLDEIGEHEDEDAHAAVPALVGGLNQGTMTLLCDVQQSQDRGTPWNVALASALREMGVPA